MRAPALSIFTVTLAVAALGCAKGPAVQPLAPSPRAGITSQESRGPADIERVATNELLPVVVAKGARPYLLAERMQHFAIPGVSIAVVREGKVAWAGAFGVKDASTKQAVTPTTLFQAGSISKPVATIATLRMVDDGQLFLDEDVNGRLVSWKVPRADGAPAEGITLRRLLSHTAGLGVHGFGGYQAGAAFPSLVQLLDGKPPANSAPVRVERTPGERMVYSGGGFEVVELLATEVGKRPFADLARAKLFEPLGLARSTYAQPLPFALQADAASGHEDGAPISGKWKVYPELTAAGLWTTPTELARIFLDLSAGLEGKSKVLSAKTTREMLTAQKQGYGLGVGVEGEGPSARFSHGGVNEGFEAYFVMFPALGEGAVVMTNGGGGVRLAKEIIRGLARDRGWPGWAPVERAVASLSSDALAAIAGGYEITIDPKTKQSFELTREGAGLTLRAKGDRPQHWLPASDTTFFTSDSETTFKVVKSGGAVTELLIHQTGATYHALKTR